MPIYFVIHCNVGQLSLNTIFELLYSDLHFFLCVSYRTWPVTPCFYIWRVIRYTQLWNDFFRNIQTLNGYSFIFFEFFFLWFFRSPLRVDSVPRSLKFYRKKVWFIYFIHNHTNGHWLMLFENDILAPATRMNQKTREIIYKPTNRQWLTAITVKCRTLKLRVGTWRVSPLTNDHIINHWYVIIITEVNVSTWCFSGVVFGSRDVLADDAVRLAIKEFSYVFPSNVYHLIKLTFF